MGKKCILFLLLFILSSAVFAQQKFVDLNFFGGLGYTQVDIPEATGYDGDYLEDWNQFHYKITPQVMFWFTQEVAVGVEIGFQNLYYYYFRIPDGGGTYYYRSNTVAPFNACVVAQHSLLPYLDLQAGLGGYIYLDGVAPGFFSAGSYSFKLGESMTIPVGLRIDVIFADAMTIPVSLTVGF